jgi:serine/threonine protein phosphatase PrpC
VNEETPREPTPPPGAIIPDPVGTGLGSPPASTQPEAPASPVSAVHEPQPSGQEAGTTVPTPPTVGGVPTPTPLSPPQVRSIGDPGRAALTIRPRANRRFPNVPDTSVDGFVVDGPAGPCSVTLLAASSRGLSHRYYAQPRQDAYAVRLTNDGDHVVLAVADGVSAGEWSHVAAQAAADAAADCLSEQLVNRPDATELDPDWPRVVDTVNTALWDAFLSCDDPAAQSIASGPPVEDSLRHAVVARLMSSTLVTAVVPTGPDGSGRWTAWLAGLGDTSAWILRADRTWTPLTMVKNQGAAIATSATAAFPCPDPGVGAHRVIDLTAGDALVLMSDGVGDPLGDGTGEVGVQLASWWHTPPSMLEFADQIAFARRSFDDDRTVVAVWVQEH